MADSGPRDRFNIVFFIFILHGIGCLIPWNMFITAKSYFVEYKLGGDAENGESGNYAAHYLQYVGLASQIPNVAFNWINVFVKFGGDFTLRIVFTIPFIAAIFVFTIFLAILDSSSWIGLFFWLTMISVVLMNILTGIYQNTIFGMAATMPFKYTGGIILGQNICGLLVTIVSMLSSYVFSTVKTAAIYYFLMAILVLMACFDTFFLLPLNKIFRHHENIRKNATKAEGDDESTPYLAIFKEAFIQLFNVFFIFFITLAVFPAVNSDVKKSSSDFFIPDSYFVVYTCFFTFNLFAMLGSLTASWIQWPSSKYLIIPVALRALYIPLFLFCNYRPLNVTRKLPVLIENDWIYWIIAVTMAYSSGYLSALAMMYAPQAVTPKHQATAGMLACAMLVTGVFVGISFSLIAPYVI